MMYSEFLEIAKVSEDKITFKTYAEVIEPMYMGCNLSKQEFINLLNIRKIIETYENPYSLEKQIIKNKKNGILDIELVKKLYQIRMFPTARDISTCFHNPDADFIVYTALINTEYEIKITDKKVFITRV